MMRTRFWLLHLLLGSSLIACEGDGPRDHGGEGTDSSPENRAGAPATSRPAGGPGAAAPRTITLLTGDRITVAGGDRVTIAPAAGRARAQFRTQRIGGHLHVVPSDAAPLVSSGQLDPRLFDVTELLELDYDDAQRTDLPLIVTYQPGSARSSGARLASAGATVTRRLASVNGESMRAPKGAAPAIWSALVPSARGVAPALAGPVARIWLDGKRKLVLDHSAGQIGAPAAWAAGLTGAGVTVAVLDSGIALAHPDFAGRIVEARSFLDGVPEADDLVGHGTHVAGILAGSGAVSDGQFRGIAPDAQLLIGKVCDFGCPESSIIAGMEWAAEGGAAVVNLSLGGPDSPGIDPLEQAIDQLTEQHGTLFVAAAGNRGQCGGSDRLRVSSPGTADAALSVGAVDPIDQLAFFSCRGPRVGDSGLKPEITAPGVGIVSARAAGTPIGDGDPVGEFYARLSGTSMATPHVAGAAALLRQQHPDWRAGELKSALMGSAAPHPQLGVFEQGAGRVDVARAITRTVSGSPAILSFGRPLWPHDDDLPISRTVGYRNHGGAAVTLQLALELTGPDGAPPPAGMFTVEPGEVTVPPGGQADVTVTVDTRVNAVDGVFTGAVVATAGDQPLRTLLMVDREVESYDLELSYLDRDGAPAVGSTSLVDLDTAASVDLGTADGSATARVPRGRYILSSIIDGVTAEPRTYVALLVQPLFEVSQESSLTLDARLAERIAISVPPPTAARTIEGVQFARQTAAGFIDGGVQFFSELDGVDDIYTAHLGPDVPPSEFGAFVTSNWAEPGPDGDFFGTPYSYLLAFLPEPGRYPTGFERSVEDSELAAVHADYSAQAPGQLGVASSFPLPDLPITSFSARSFTHSLPGSMTEHLSAEDVVWFRDFTEVTPDLFGLAKLDVFSFRSFEAGRDYHERWNRAVLGPSFNEAEDLVGGVSRFGNFIDVSYAALHNDSDDHFGSVNFESGHTRLFRDGALVGETDFPAFGSFEAPPEPGNYRLEIESIRVDQDNLSTRVNAAWSFRSQEGGDEPEPLPLFAVRFAPFLDGDNSAPAGRIVAVPISVSRQAGGASVALRRLTVQASYDRGQSWAPALVIRIGDFAVAFLDHPDGEGTVSLRATATDKSDNRIEQTIVDAYRLRE